MSGPRRAVMAAFVCAMCGLSTPLAPQPRLRAADMGDAQEVTAPRPGAASPPAAAPVPPPAPPLPAPPFPGQAEGGDVDRRSKDDVVRIATDYALKTGDGIGDLVVVLGNATVEGHVRGDMAVVLGEVRLGPAAVVDGDLAVVGGTLKVSTGAVVRHDLVVAAGSYDAPADFVPGGEQVVVGFKGLGTAVSRVLPWLTRGLLMGRPIVPDLPWVWGVVAVLFAVYLGVLLIFERPVRYAAETLTATPLRALATGLGTLLVAGPLLLLLTASVVGLLAVPFAVCAFLVAGLVGKVAATTWLGARLLPEGDDTSRLTLARSFAAGCVVLILVYMVPVLGGVVWATAGAFGLGASVLAFVAAYRRENPPVVRAPIITPPIPEAPASAVPEGAAVRSEPVVASAAAPVSPDSRASVMAAMPHAAFADRLAAFVLDAILVSMVIMLMSSIRAGAFLPLLLAYRFAFWAWKGATVGGIICQLRVTRLDGSLVGPGEALVRSLSSIFSIGVLGLGCLWILRDADRQAWHDKVAGTFVVKVPRQWPI